MKRNTIAVFKNQFNEFKSSKIQWLLVLIAPLVAFVFPRVLALEVTAGIEYWDYPNQVAPVVGVLVTSAISLCIFALTVAGHRKNGYLSDTKLIPYLLGVGGFYLILTMVGAVFVALAGQLGGFTFANFMLITLLTFICSALIGAIIGILSKSKQMAFQIVYPLSAVIILVFKYRNGVPAIPLEQIRPHINWLYLERMNNMLFEVHTGNFIVDVYFMLGNIVVLTVVLTILYNYHRKTSANASEE